MHILFQEDEMSANDSSGESSGAESPPPQDLPPQPPPIPPPQSKATPTSRATSTAPPTGTPATTAAAAMVAPLLYQVPPNGVIFSLAQPPPGGGDQPQFITIPLSVAMAATNGHQELDLSNKKVK